MKSICSKLYFLATGTSNIYINVAIKYNIDIESFLRTFFIGIIQDYKIDFSQQTITFKNGSVIKFKNYRDVNDTRGLHIDILYIPEQIDPEIEFQLRLRTKYLIINRL